MWALHFVMPGTHQVTRFTAPRGVPDFDFVRLNKSPPIRWKPCWTSRETAFAGVGGSAADRRSGAWQVAKETQPQSQPETLAVALAGPRLM